MLVKSVVWLQPDENVAELGYEQVPHMAAFIAEFDAV